MSSKYHKDDGDFEFTFTLRFNLAKLQGALAFAAILLLALNAHGTRPELVNALLFWLEKLRALAP